MITITLKYKIGDKVWFMKDNACMMSEVMNWEVNGLRPQPTYFLVAGSYPEDKLYPSKEELIKSL